MLAYLIYSEDFLSLYFFFFLTLLGNLFYTKNILYWGRGNYSCLGNPMDRGTWWATVHKAIKSQT